jgi:hypothetical protein
LATLVVPIESIEQQSGELRLRGDERFAVFLISALTIFCVAVNGYHPFAEDGGLYLAGVERLVDPALFPHQTEFVLAPMRFSLFAPVVAGLVRYSHMALQTALLTLHLASIWATLFAAWMLAARCWTTRTARAGAVLLLACWLGLPVAGTALSLMDPYLTARSFSTPCTLLALVGALDAMRDRRCRKGLALMFGSLAVAAAMHPLMATYAAIAAFLLIALQVPDRKVRVGSSIAICVGVIVAAACATLMSPAESAAYREIALTRSYWFPAQWRWYELAGLAAPLAILVAIASQRREIDPKPSAQRLLAQMAVLAGTSAFAVAVFFARMDSETHLVARLQPLRIFHIVYLVMTILAGGLLAEHILKRRLWRWGCVGLVLGSSMFAVARASFPHSPHLEIPGTSSNNAWVQAFTWIRENTPKDVLFALDGDYINAPDEDAQCFRAIAQRSVLPDYSKDGGETSIAPALTPLWTAGQQAQRNLSAPSTTDAERISALSPMGVTWLVMDSQAATALDCPYANSTLKVCRLQPPQQAK